MRLFSGLAFSSARADGLVGLNFLSGLNYETRSAERRILSMAPLAGEFDGRTVATNPGGLPSVRPLPDPSQIQREPPEHRIAR